MTLALRAGGAQFSLGADEAEEVLRNPKITRVPNAPAALDGVASLRGAILPIFSLARLLDLPDATLETGRFVLVLADRGMGLRVDGVTTLRDADAKIDTIRPLDIEKLARAHLQPSLRTSRRARAESAVAKALAPVEQTVLLGLELAGQSYALPLAHVDEVLATPQGVTQLPDSQAGDLGVVMVRDALLPLISLSSLLGLSSGARDSAARHVIVARLGGARVGLAVERLTSVKRARNDALSPVPAILNRGGGEARIASIFRDADAGLISVLSAQALFADPRLAEQIVQAEADREAKPMPTDAREADLEQIVVFRLGTEEYGLPIAAVDEIARLPDAPTRLPRAPAFVKGVMNLRGRIVPLIDQNSRFGLVSADDSAGGTRKRVIVTKVDALLAGFIVDEVREILNVSASQMRLAPSVGATDPQTFDRVAMLDGESRMILMIDPQELLNRAERDLLANETWTGQKLADA